MPLAAVGPVTRTYSHYFRSTLRHPGLVYWLAALGIRSWGAWLVVPSPRGRGAACTFYVTRRYRDPESLQQHYGSGLDRVHSLTAPAKTRPAPDHRYREEMFIYKGRVGL